MDLPTADRGHPAAATVAVDQRRSLGLLLCALVLAAVSVLSLAIGTQNVGLSTVWQAVTHYTDSGDQWIVHDLRIPRTVLGIVVGIALGLSGALIQGLTRNPLADSQILGIESVAGLFVVSAIAFLGLRSVMSYVWFAFVGAFAAMALVYIVGATGRAVITPVRMLLAGVAVGAVADGVSFVIRLHYPRAFESMRFWDAGALDGRPMTVVGAVASFIAIGAALCLYVSRGLNALALGDDLAVAMGGNVVRTRVLGMLAVTLLTGAAMAAAGPIGFVGLMVPHAVRWFTGPDWRWTCAYCVFIAPALLLASDVVGRVVVPPGELPVGIVTAFIGAPILIWLVRRSRLGGCVHPASGLSWQFAGLKRFLPEQVPLYGLQWPLFSTGTLPDTIAELARGYADSVEQVAPTGPIRLLGWSFGGSVALLVAGELERRGREVTFVGMLDARTDVADGAEFDPAAVLASLLREMGFPVDPGARMTVADAVTLVRDSGDAIAILDDARIAQVIENYVAAERLTANADYGRYGGEMFFVDATVLEMDLVGTASAGWRDHVGGRLRAVALDCRHSELMDIDLLERLGPLIAAELRREDFG